MEELDIIQYRDGRPGAYRDAVAGEARVSVWVDGKEVAGLMALPANLEELALGFLFGECFFDRPSEVLSLSVNPRLHSVSVTLAGPARAGLPEVFRTFTTGCGRGVSRVSPRWSDHFPVIETAVSHAVADILGGVRRLTQSSELFRRTGCVHTAGLWLEGDIRWTCDDIGRHNAVDKAIGHALRECWPPGDGAMLVCTGRLSSDIVLKTVRAGIPVLVSRSAPTGGAVQIARNLGVTLVGFVRAERCNVYTHPDRVRPA